MKHLDICAWRSGRHNELDKGALLELLRNAFFSLILQLSPRFSDVLLFVLISQRMGPYEAGLFSLAIAYLRITLSAMTGLDDLLTRQILRAPELAPRYFTAFLVARFGLTLLLYGTVFLVVRIPGLYALHTANLVLLFAIGLIPENLCYVAQAGLLGCKQFGLPALGIGLMNIFKLVGGGLVLVVYHSLLMVAIMWIVGSLIGATLLLTVAFKHIGGTFPIDWSVWRSHWREAATFLFITILLGLESQIDTIILGALRGEIEVGWYRAATTIVYTLALLATAYHLAVYPLMTTYALTDRQKLTTLYAQSMRGLSLLVFPIIAGVWALAPQIIALVFHSAFAPAASALRIAIFSLLFLFLNAPNMRLLLVLNRQRPLAICIAGGVMINIFLNGILIPYWGFYGAAIARVCSTALPFLLLQGYVQALGIHAPVGHSMLRALVAATLMGGCVQQMAGLPLWASVPGGIALYGVLLLLTGSIRWHEAQKGWEKLRYRVHTIRLGAKFP